ncbi:integral membrane family protein [Apiospora saccharicola]|uniref:Integral membrane family protein n=1 Tax=Apiospora saccharicola TaxID=335842 RepID=A0ABR1TJK2_9PEZI
MAAQDPTVSTESNGFALLVTSVVFLTLTWISVFLRTYVRAIMLKGFQADDWLMLISQIIFTISCAFILAGYFVGLGRHNKSLDQPSEIAALEFQALATATYVLDMMFIKLSIGIFLLRLATQKRYRYLIWGSLVVITIWSLALFFWNLFQCNPVPAQWDYTILERDPKAHCASGEEIVSAAYALSVMTILSDWLYALIPIPIVWNVKMTTQAKITVVLILSMGVFASIATLIRLKFLADLTDLSDILYGGTDSMVWTLVEPGVAIIASSLVTIRPLLRAWKIKGFASSGVSKQTGPFSNGQAKSRTNRSNGAMPGFGSRDVTLVDIELGYLKNSKSGDFDNTTHITSRSRMSYMSRISERADQVSRPDSVDATVTRRVEISIEPNVRQPPETGETRETFLDGQSRSSSTVELTPESQHRERSDSDRSRGF